MMWVDKYAPKSIEDIKGNETLLRQLASFCNPECTDALPHMVLNGPTGVGKTTVINMIVKNQLRGMDRDTGLLCFNSADDRSIQAVRDKIYQFVPRKVPEGRRKIVVFEQADLLGEGVQQLMRTLMEKYAKHTTFVFVCDKLHGIIDTIQSRCIIYQLKRIEEGSIVQHLKYIAKEEGVGCVSDDVFKTFALLTKGDLRQCINYMQVCVAALSNSGEQAAPLNMDIVLEMCVFPHLQVVSEVFEAIAKRDVLAACSLVIDLYKSGYSAVDVLMFMNTLILLNSGYYDEDNQSMVMKEIAICHSRVTTGIDSEIQLCGMIARIIRKFKTGS
jgi:DNA polymerase III delta prime subunit